MFLSQAEHQLLHTFQLIFEGNDVTKRDGAIFKIKFLEQSNDFLPSLFHLIANYSYHNPKPQIIEAIINWIWEYLDDQDESLDGAVQKMQLLIDGIDLLLKTKHIRYKILIPLSNILAKMINTQSNETLKFQLIDTFPKLILENPDLLFFELYSLLSEKESQMVLNKILANLNGLLQAITDAQEDSFHFYLQVASMLFQQAQPSINYMRFKNIVEHESFMIKLLNAIQTGDKQISKTFSKIVTTLTDLKDALGLQETSKLDQIYNLLFTIVVQIFNSESPQPFVSERDSLTAQNKEEVINQNQDDIYSIFRVFCYSLVYNKQEFQIEKIKEIVLLILKQKALNLKQRMNPLEQVLLIHLFIDQNIEHLSFQYLKTFIGETINALDSQSLKNNKTVYGKYLLIILQCLRFRYQQTSSIIKLKNQHYLQQFQKTALDFRFYNDGYDRKVFVANLTQMIFNKTLQSKFTYTALRALVFALFNQFNALRLQSIEHYMDSSDESENQDYEDSDLVLNDNSKEIFKCYLNPYSKTDEYGVFRQLVQKNKITILFSQIYKQVINDLPFRLKRFIMETIFRIPITSDKNIENRQASKGKINQKENLL